jgi:hypothetical protein
MLKRSSDRKNGHKLASISAKRALGQQIKTSPDKLSLNKTPLDKRSLNKAAFDQRSLNWTA